MDFTTNIKLPEATAHLGIDRSISTASKKVSHIDTSQASWVESQKQQARNNLANLCKQPKDCNDSDEISSSKTSIENIVDKNNNWFSMDFKPYTEGDAANHLAKYKEILINYSKTNTVFDDSIKHNLEKKLTVDDLQSYIDSQAFKKLKKKEKFHYLVELFVDAIAIEKLHGNCNINAILEAWINVLSTQERKWDERLDRDPQTISISMNDSSTVAQLTGYSRHKSAIEDFFLAESFSINNPYNHENIALTAVMDGHGGTDIVKYVTANLKDRIEENLNNCKEPFTKANIMTIVQSTLSSIHYASPSITSGTTLVLCLQFKNSNQLWTFNVGDSRAYMLENMQLSSLTDDAKPGKEPYKEVIYNRGGTVENYTGIPRVSNQIATARTIGDIECIGTSPLATVTNQPIPNEAMLLQASDGFTDVADDTSIKYFLNKVLSIEEVNLEVAIKILLQLAYSSYTNGRSRDDITIMVTPLKNKEIPDTFIKP